MPTTIRPKYMVFFHLYFLLSTTIQPILKVLTDLFLLFAHSHSTKMYRSLWFVLLFRTIWPKLGSSLIYFFYLYTAIQPNYMVLFHLFFLLCTTNRPKIKVLINLLICTRPFDQKLGAGRFSRIAGNAGNYRNDGKFNKSHEMLNHI